MQVLLMPSPAHWYSHPVGLIRIPWALLRFEKLYGLPHSKVQNKKKNKPMENSCSNTS